jgi:hypothetical protein
VRHPIFDIRLRGGSSFLGCPDALSIFRGWGCGAGSKGQNRAKADPITFGSRCRRFVTERGIMCSFAQHIARDHLELWSTMAGRAQAPSTTSQQETKPSGAFLPRLPASAKSSSPAIRIHEQERHRHWRP